MLEISLVDNFRDCDGNYTNSNDPICDLCNCSTEVYASVFGKKICKHCLTNMIEKIDRRILEGCRERR